MAPNMACCTGLAPLCAQTLPINTALAPAGLALLEFVCPMPRPIKRKALLTGMLSPPSCAQRSTCTTALEHAASGSCLWCEPPPHTLLASSSSASPPPLVIGRPSIWRSRLGMQPQHSRAPNTCAAPVGQHAQSAHRVAPGWAEGCALSLARAPWVWTPPSTHCGRHRQPVWDSSAHTIHDDWSTHI